MCLLSITTLFFIIVVGDAFRRVGFVSKISNLFRIPEIACASSNELFQLHNTLNPSLGQAPERAPDLPSALYSRFSKYFDFRKANANFERLMTVHGQNLIAKTCSRIRNVEERYLYTYTFDNLKWRASLRLMTWADDQYGMQTSATVKVFNNCFYYGSAEDTGLQVYGKTALAHGRPNW